MKKLSATIIASYLCHVSPAFAVGDNNPDGHKPPEVTHGTNADEVMKLDDKHHGEAHGADHHGDEAHHATDAAHHGAEHGSGGLPQFDPEWFASQVFWLAMAFAFLYVVFAKKTLPDISNVIENRKNHIQSDLETAEKLTAEADAVHDAYQHGLDNAQAEASKAVLDVEQDMKTKAEAAFDEYRERSENEIKSVEERIETAKNNAMNDMNAIAAEVASVAVEKIISQQANPTQIQALIEGINKKAKAA